MRSVSGCGALGVIILATLVPPVKAEERDDLATKARAILKANCYRCHGENGAVEGGMNYVLCRERLIARRKIVPGKAEDSPLFARIARGEMPPPDEVRRPNLDDLAVLKRWIDAGAPGTEAPARTFLVESEAYTAILTDLDRLDKRSRRFARYFTLHHLANAGLGHEELESYRLALSKLLNSLSWHPRITQPKAVDPAGTLLRIDLRDFQWDVNLWNRVLTEYPYGVLHNAAAFRACCVAAASKLPCVRADWFLATASRPPLYHDLLQLPASAAELERQLRVDVAANIRQERVARAGFNGSGVARNNRLIERHDAVHGAYWKSYDFEAVPQNLVERDNLLPDRRNLFACPLGPGFGENSFQHAGGEIIFNLPNGLQAYLLINAAGQRIDRAPTSLVSDPKRPDRAVENGLSCISCHVRGIIPKVDQVREHVVRNPKAFSPADAELIQALYVPEAKMQALVTEDVERFHKALEKAGLKAAVTEPVTAMVLRYEADVDLAGAAAELGLRPDDFLARVGRSESQARNFGTLGVPGGTVQRQVLVQSFADLVRELRLGAVFQPASVALNLPDNTGEVDPLEGPANQANDMAFSRDGRKALIASADRSVRLLDVETGRELRRFVGHTASVWCVAFSPDGKRALSGGMDRSVRLWDSASGREVRRLDGHAGLVTAVAFSPDGRRAISAGYDHVAILWDLDSGKLMRRLADEVRYISCVAFSPDGRRLLVSGNGMLVLCDAETGAVTRRLEGHAGSVSSGGFSPDGRRAVSGGEDGTIRLWDVNSGREKGKFLANGVSAQSVAFSPDGQRVLSGSADGVVRVWDTETRKELGFFDGHAESVLRVAFTADGALGLSGARDSALRLWDLRQALGERKSSPINRDDP